MSVSPLKTLPRDVALKPPVDLVPNPYLHVGPKRIYNPLTDLILDTGTPAHTALHSVLNGAAQVQGLAPTVREELRRALWLVPEEEGSGHRAFRLKYVSLESHTVCNQKCYFCPVAYAPREPYFMPTELYRRILSELAAYRDTVEGVFMINYNEPTLDRRFVEQVGWIKEAGLPAATLTNGSGLTPKRVDALCALGGLRFLSINISTIDREKYKKDRGADQAEQIVRNLEYAGQHPVAEEMEMVVLGEGDAAHDQAFAEIQERFAGSRFQVQQRRLMNRAGYLQIGNNANLVGRCLGGCENIGSRPLQHLHITPHGQCVLCCEDYDEKYIVGDLTEASVEAVLTGERFAQLRRWAYGVEEAPDDFICRHCIYALAR